MGLFSSDGKTRAQRRAETKALKAKAKLEAKLDAKLQALTGMKGDIAKLMVDADAKEQAEIDNKKRKPSREIRTCHQSPARGAVPPSVAPSGAPRHRG